MGYFSNATEHDLWSIENCNKCENNYTLDPESPDYHTAKNCPIQYAHLIKNYDDCNNPESILHLFIPRSKDGCGNEQCAFFIQAQKKEGDIGWLEPFIKKIESQTQDSL